MDVQPGLRHAIMRTDGRLDRTPAAGRRLRGGIG
jgi:hypothetical protein